MSEKMQFPLEWTQEVAKKSKIVRQPSPCETVDFPPLSGRYATLTANGNTKKIVELPDYGEVKIVTHGGKITFIETTTKEKVE